MRTKQETIEKINSLSFRTIAFMKNIVNITKKYFETNSLDKESYGEAIFSLKVLRENVIKSETSEVTPKN